MDPQNYDVSDKNTNASGKKRLKIVIFAFWIKPFRFVRIINKSSESLHKLVF